MANGEEAGEITGLLNAWSNGDEDALAKLIPIVYGELRRIAQRQMAREHPGHTLQPSALVNEAYIRLVDCNAVQWKNRAHFFGIMAGLMRRILVDLARTRRNQKRGGNWRRVTLDGAIRPTAATDLDLVAVDEALEDMARIDVRKAKVVELRFFAGLTVEETAEVLQISGDTVERDWTFARAWLMRELRPGKG
jgi:RNA polymerase sigma factor (TIGR02999 family)